MQTVDGMGWGCPVVGKVAERTADGKVRVELSGWLPAVPEIKGQTLPAEIGCHRIAVVDSGICIYSSLRWAANDQFPATQ